MNNVVVDEYLRLYVKEDVFPFDITVDTLITSRQKCRAVIKSRESGVLCGVDFVKRIFNISGRPVKVDALYRDGDIVGDEVIIQIEGDSDIILSYERTALNLLSRLSGIASYTNAFVKKITNKHIKLLDTRKTTPGLRFFEKYAFRIGGGYNHRYNLSQMVLVKENHFKLFRTSKELLELLFRRLSYPVKVEIEVGDMDLLREVIKYKPDIIMLDNFNIDEIKEALDLIQGKSLIEVSGDITLNNISNYNELDIDFISTSKPIMNSASHNLSLLIE